MMMTKQQRRKQEVIRLIGVDDRLAIAIGIPLVAFLVPLMFFIDDLPNGIRSYWPKFIISLLHTISFWFSVRGVIIFMRKQYTLVKETGKRIMFSFLLLIPIYLVISFSIDLICFPIVNFFGGKKIPIDFFRANVASITIIALVWAIYESIYMYARWKDSIVEQERLHSQFIQSQLEGLKSQVNPHFLFNSLNTLAYIIPEDSTKAVKFVEKLAKVYRYILEIQDRRLIPLHEELAFLESYVFLHQERFGKNLQVKLKVSEEARHNLIVPLSLQILFENAFKHNIISNEHPLTVSLVATTTKLTICNNLQRRNSNGESTKIGLANIQNRYVYFTDQPVVIEETDTIFSVTIPLIQSPVLVEFE